MASRTSRQEIREIRAVIQTLSSLLSYYGLPKLPSETYRKAKFDSAEVADDMWTLLAYSGQLAVLLSSCQHDLCRCNDFETVQSRMQPMSGRCDWTKLAVRKLLYSLGYSRLAFYSRGSCSSREALLAFGWLLHEQKLIERLRSMHLCAIKACGLPVPEPTTALVKSLQSRGQSVKHELESLLDLSNKQCLPSGPCLQRLVWLRGFLDSEWASLLSTARSYRKLAHLLNTFTASPSGKHLSVYELVLLRSPDHLREVMNKREKQLAVCKAFLEWELSAPRFWQWMESVLDMEQQHEDDVQGSGVDKAKTVTLDSEALASEVKALQSNATGLLAGKQVHLEYIDAVISRSHLDPVHLEEHDLKLRREPIHLCRRVFGNLVSMEHKRLRHSISSMCMLTELDLAVYCPGTRKSKELGMVGPECSPRLFLNDSESLKQLKETIKRKLQEISGKLPPSICAISKQL